MFMKAQRIMYKKIIRESNPYSLRSVYINIVSILAPSKILSKNLVYLLHVYRGGWSNVLSYRHY